MQIYFLLIPLYFVLNFLIKSSSLSFLTKGSWLWTFSKIVTFMSLMLCPGRLKWAPVAFVRCLFVTYALCSLNRSCRVRSDSLIYCILQCSQNMQYIIFFDLQLTEVLMSIFVLFDVALTLLQGMTNGQIGHLVHVFMPGMILIGLLGAKGGTFALISLSHILGGRLYATKGGRGNTSFR